MARRSGSRRFKLLGAATLFVVVGWSALWFIAATVVDRQVDKAEKMAMDAGATATCVNRSVSGFPFRIEVRCGEGSRAGNADGILTLGGVTVAAQVYDPSRLIAEVQGPLALSSARALPIEADWALAHASAHLSLADSAVAQFIGEVKGLSITVGPHAMTVGEVDASVRRSPEDPANLDLFLRLADVVPMADAAPSTVALTGRVDGGGAMLAGRPEAVVARLAASGLPVTIEAMTFASGDMEVAATGEVTLSPDGLLNGTVDVAVAGYDGGVPYLAELSPALGRTVAQVLPTMLTIAPEATVGERRGKKVPLRIVDSHVSLGLMPIMQLPRVDVAALQ